MIIREIGTDDFAQAQRILDEVYVGEGYAPHEYRANVRDVKTRSAAPETWTFVAEDHGNLLGYVIVCRAGSPLRQIAGNADAEIRLLATTPTARGRGVGASLVAACIDQARQIGCTRIVLTTQTVMHSAQRLYARLGFRRWPAGDRDWNARQFLAYELGL